MNNNFWTEFKQPIFALAPMEDVTDTSFRQIVAEIAKPDYLHVLMTEFVNTDGLLHEVGRDIVAQRLVVNESERNLLKEKDIKLVAQIWGKNPDHFYKATKWICENYDFDGIDINFGCPVKNVVKQGACSALIDKPELARDIVIATKEASNIPVSVKTRTGVKQHDTERWITQLLETKPAALTLHGRTQKMQSDYPADWNQIKLAAEVKNAILPEIPLLGNGDVFSHQNVKDDLELSNADGVMIGRGIFENPWFFNPDIIDPDPETRLSLLWRQAILFLDTWKDTKNFAVLRRFFKIYVYNFEGAARLRAKLMTVKDIDSVYDLLKENPHFKG
ncbi:MAG: tRNA dihydrouridine synthase [Hyphomicrobiales bacterium]